MPNWITKLLNLFHREKPAVVPNIAPNSPPDLRVPSGVVPPPATPYPPPLKVFPYGTTVLNKMTAGLLNKGTPPDGVYADPVYVEAKDASLSGWYERQSIVLTRMQDPGVAGDALVNSTLDTGERELPQDHPVPFRSQKVPDVRTFTFNHPGGSWEIATGGIPGGVGEGYSLVSVRVRNPAGEEAGYGEHIAGYNNVRGSGPAGQYTVVVNTVRGGAYSVIYHRY